MTIDKDALVRALGGRITGPLSFPGDAGYESDVKTFNLAIVHRPEAVVAATSAEDVAAVLRAARDLGFKVCVQGGGHGAYVAMQSGVLVTTRLMNRLEIHAESRVATIGAGVRWAQVVEAASKHGLAPNCGSSTNVGVVGFLLGGGLGPLARSHGFGSDYAVGFTVVTGQGEILEATADANPDLFWSLRGGKGMTGIVTEVRLRLLPLRTLYAGSLMFDEPHIETALRGWVDWTENADPKVTTSVCIARFPPSEAVPAALRNKRLLGLRFAYPGESEVGHRLAQPLRELGPVYLDALGEMPVSEVARIHSDPTEPGPAWTQGKLLTAIDHEFVSALLRHAGPDSPLVGVEVRHMGQATRRDVEGGSAVGGRSSTFALGIVGVDEALFDSMIPGAAAALVRDIAPWLSPETNINYVGRGATREEVASAWSKETYARLRQLRAKYDPDGIVCDAHSA